MYNYRGFDHLFPGTWVTVSGKPESNGIFNALEITLKRDEGVEIIEGLIQGIDSNNGTLRIVNKNVHLPIAIYITDVEGIEVPFSSLKLGDLIRIEGKYLENNIFVAEAIELRERLEFNLEILHGPISRVNSESKTLNMFGLTVEVHSRTSVAGVD